MAKKGQKKPSKKSKTKGAAKKKKVTAKAKKPKAAAKKAAATPKKGKASAKKAAPKKKAKAPAKKAAPMKKSTPKSAGATKSFSVTEFADMTYLTKNGVRQWLQRGLLRGSQDARGKWQIEASNLEVPNVKRLVR